MKKDIFLIVISLLAIAFMSCQKDYRCVCTNSTTGHVSYGDNMKANMFTKKAAEEACKGNNELSAGGLKDCHLE